MRRSRSDPRAFTEVYDRHWQRLLLFLTRRTFDPHVALDLTAETLAQAFASRRRFRGTTDAEEQAWLFAIARHQLAGYLRRGRIERKALDKLGIEVPSMSDEDHERIERLAGLADLRTAVREALQGLTEDQRLAVELRVVDELPYSEVAARLAITEEAARARVSRGLRALADGLDLAVVQEASG
ncbi:MAG TPA: RNA polymerase sigma factor [Thermoleophilaceae bacterium]|nr:RNA polymerase sigma factor [Thermoleophilaceae bacterium]